MFGFKKHEKKTDTIAKEERTAHGEVEYVGGHKLYPKPGIKRIFFYSDRIEIEILAKQGKQEKIMLIIPYSSMISIENIDDKTISGMRVVMLGIMGALLKKRHIYTLIHYKDELDEHKIVLDFEDNIEYAQGIIYKKFLEARKKKNDEKMGNDNNRNLSVD